MSTRHRVAAATAVLASSVLTPAVAYAAAEPVAAGASELSAGRLGGLVAALVGIAGVVVGGLALARRGGRLGTGGAAIAAAVAGLFAIALGALVVVTADGGLGTGNGLGGGIVAMVIGLIALIVGGLARARRVG
ncbi:hypothetical protein IU474_18765 [Nocardia otitidiscaviarum]|uniref:DUF6223 family protein n=1 Tax=Nocardia otitidiscaviarum TaxID=1823 RepID=UPI001892FB75|nr:DUF6223 family protein [Nocardia otitidiscaviarum]MBF6239095.1 hypothetical protein [Nocardia otitidiscaviarum]